MAQDARKVIGQLRHGTRTGPDLLRIASYNIHGCVGIDSRYDVERVAQVICELGCDTVGLQEVDGRPGLLSDCLQLEFLATATGMTAVTGATLLGPGRHYGNALLTRRRILSVRHYDLTCKDCESRTALDVALEAGSGSIRVMVTHLGLRAAERRFQVKKLLTVLRAIPAGQPVVVLGDINEWLPMGRPLRWLHGLLGKPPSQRTFPVWAPLLALDRVWARPAAALLAVEAHKTARSRRASDHFPVKATVSAQTARQSSQRR